MGDEKRVGANLRDLAGNFEDTDEEGQGGLASRARNRTVMLTPEMTGQVRAMVHEGTENSGKADPLSELLSPVQWEKSEEKEREVKKEEPEVKFEELEAGAEEPEQPELALPVSDSRRRKETSELVQSASADAGNTANPSAQRFSVNPNVGVSAAVKASPHVLSSEESPPRSIAAPSPVAVASPASWISVVSSGERSRIVGLMICFDKDTNGDVLEIRSGRWLLTSHAMDQGDYILVDDKTISPLHAILRANKEGRIEVLDQLSEFGTAIRRHGSEQEEEVTGAMVSVNHGDVVRFGELHFLVCLVP